MPKFSSQPQQSVKTPDGNHTIQDISLINTYEGGPNKVENRNTAYNGGEPITDAE